ncbi:MAG TPA: cytochrome c [Blastocatellia bacterium]|nr:cytochrome c [Blastocatellia bacterium]
MTAKRYTGAIFLLAFCWASGCNRLPGKPSQADRWVAPSEVASFDQLYAQNCAGCHGSDGRLGAARPLNDPLYLNLISQENLSKVIRQGVPSTSMPPFAQKFGGQLTDAQVDLLAEQMRSRWGHPEEFKDATLPPYSEQEASAKGTGAGDPQRGATVYSVYCSQCHGADGRGGKALGSIVDPNYLALVSDQSLRTTVIVGRQDMGKPDCRQNTPGHPMSAQEVSDVVAWLAAQRPNPLARERAQAANRSASENRTTSPVD